MKSFFSNFLSSLLALMVYTIGIIVFMVVVISIIVAYMLSSPKEKINKNSVLKIELKNQIYDRDKDEVDDFFGNSSAIGINDLAQLVEFAKRDNRISALWIEANSIPNNLSITNQLYRILKDFKSSGKKIYAFGDYNEKTYYVSSLANNIYAAHEGVFEWNGSFIQIMFFKNLMDKLDINAQIFYAGKFKSATEPFRRENMTEENKTQLLEIITQFEKQMYTEISKNRKIPIEKLKEYANNLSVKNLQDAKKLNFISDILYEDQVKAKIKNDLKLKNDDLDFITIAKYKKSLGRSFNHNSKNKIAILYAIGDIINGNTEDENTISDENYLNTISQIEKQDDIKGVVVRINSGGGSAQASDKIWRALEKLKQKKTVVVSMGGVAASGGYYIASAANKIVAEPFTITGSIGVFALIPDFSNFLKNKLGITFDDVATSRNAVLSIAKKFTPAQQQYIQNHIDEVYLNFKTVVAKSRHKPLTQIEELAQGRVWTGTQALKNGLVDTLGYLEDAIEMVARKEKYIDYDIEAFPKLPNKIEVLMDKFADKIATQIKKQHISTSDLEEIPQLKTIQKNVLLIKKIANESQAQTKILFDFDIQ